MVTMSSWRFNSCFIEVVDIQKYLAHEVGNFQILNIDTLQVFEEVRNNCAAHIVRTQAPLKVNIITNFPS